MQLSEFDWELLAYIGQKNAIGTELIASERDWDHEAVVQGARRLARLKLISTADSLPGLVVKMLDAGDRALASKGR